MEYLDSWLLLKTGSWGRPGPLAHSGRVLPLLSVTLAYFIRSLSALGLHSHAREPMETHGWALPDREAGAISTPVPPSALSTDKVQE